jgi:flagellar capping protein FliD
MAVVRTRQTQPTPAHNLRALEQRLADAEQQLQVQFARMAQMQAALDLVHAALRRPPALVQNR